MQLDQITSNLNALNISDSEYKGLIENAFLHLENFKQNYTNSAIAHKKKLISSILTSFLIVQIKPHHFYAKVLRFFLDNQLKKLLKHFVLAQ